MTKYMANQDIRKAAKEANIPLYKLALLFGVSEFTFSRKMRYEFSDQDKRKALEIIRELSGATNLEEAEHNE